MNTETAILIALGLAVMIIVALYGSTSGVFNAVGNVVTGENGLISNATDKPAKGVVLLVFTVGSRWLS